MAVTFQQPFSNNKIDEIIICKVYKQNHFSYYGDDSYTTECVNCSMNHYHSNSYAYIV